MKVILLKSVEKLGDKDDIKEVSPGYARNFLIPKGLAQVTTEEIIKLVKKREKKRDKAKLHSEKIKDKTIEKLKGVVVTFQRKANKEGHLFAGLRENDIIKEIGKITGLKIKKENVLLAEPIKSIGQKTVTISIDNTKKVDIEVNIKSE